MPGGGLDSASAGPDKEDSPLRNTPGTRSVTDPRGTQSLESIENYGVPTNHRGTAVTADGGILNVRRLRGLEKYLTQNGIFRIFIPTN
jgi:hypothetical protein